MRKLPAIFLIVLLLAGCGVNEAPSTPTETTVPVSTGLYDPDSAVEQQTGGAVRAYPLENDNYIGLASMGSKLLLVSGSTEFTVLNGELCEPAVTMVAGKAISLSDPDFCVTEMGLSYYIEAARQVVVLNPQLQETARYTLPEDIQGSPAVSLKNNEIYYCVGQEIRALDMQTQISRMIKSHTCASQQLTGIYFDGAVLACQITDRAGASGIIYLSSQTGQTLSADMGIFSLQTYGQDYFALRTDGLVQQQIFGQLDKDPESLNVDPGIGGWLTGVLPLNGAVSYTADETGLHLSFYDFETGKRAAAVTLNGVASPTALHADSQYLWIISYENETGKQVLYRWELSKSSVQEGTVYTGPLYTAQSPDTQGLAQCQTRVDGLNSRYGVRIHIWEDAVSQTGDYPMEAEHQVQTINGLLDELEAVLPLFPEDFLRQTVEAGWIRINLVRSIDGELPYVQYWADGDCYIAIAMDADVKQALLQGVAYGVDSHVVGNSRDFDTWNDLNPAGFVYGQADNTFLEGEERVFADAASMENPHEDRSRIIACAMMEGNEALFASTIMQSKLLRACQGIREAYGLEKSTQTYLWEQYLNRSLAYTE